jgi:exodeoxyribonuclease VII small subunit
MAKTKRSAAGGERAAAESPDSEPAAPPFERALEQLEATVSRLEEGEMPLEEALELFESGVKLSRQCAATLEQAERRVEILVANRSNGDALDVERFDASEMSDDDPADRENDRDGEEDLED